MTIIVTGAAGYVGSTLTNLLVSNGHRVIAIDSHEVRMQRLALQLGAQTVRFLTRGLQELSEDPSVLSSADAVIHLAGISSDTAAEQDADLTWQVNVELAVALARATKDAGVPRFLLASTAAISQVPIGSRLERASGNGKSAPVPQPVGVYAQSKLAAERAITRLSDDQFEVSVLRKGSLYGVSPIMRWDLVINKMALAAWSGHTFMMHDQGIVSRPIAHVEDAARAYLHLLSTPPGGKLSVFSLVERNIVLRDVCREIDGVAREELGRGIPVRHSRGGNTQRTGSVSGDSLAQIGWHPTRSLREGIREVLRALSNGQIEPEAEAVVTGGAFRIPPRAVTELWQKRLELGEAHARRHYRR